MNYWQRCKRAEHLRDQLAQSQAQAERDRHARGAIMSNLRRGLIGFKQAEHQLRATWDHPDPLRETEPERFEECLRCGHEGLLHEGYCMRCGR